MEPPPLPQRPLSLRAGLLLLRLLTAALLIASVVLIATTKMTIRVQGTPLKLRFKDVYAYRYMFGAAVIVLVYSILQLLVAIFHLATGKKTHSSYLIDFYGDKILSYVLATALAAGFGVTHDLKDVIEELIPSNSEKPVDKFFNRGNLCAVLLNIAFVFFIVLSVISSLALRRRPTQS